eukprot:1848364-Rhodomonas_salina.1
MLTGDYGKVNLLRQIASKRIAMGWSNDQTVTARDNGFGYQRAMQELMCCRKEHASKHAIECAGGGAESIEEGDQEVEDMQAAPTVKKVIPRPCMIEPEDSDDDFQPQKPRVKPNSSLSGSQCTSSAIQRAGPPGVRVRQALLPLPQNGLNSRSARGEKGNKSAA